MAPFIMTDIIQPNWIEQGGGTSEPLGEVMGGTTWRKFNRLYCR